MSRLNVLRRASGLSAWVLWLALLLPLAQLGAAVHGYAHLQDPARTSSDKHLPAACDACAAAAVGGAVAAPSSTPARLPVPALGQAAPSYFPHASPAVAVPAPYQSRAPPS